MDVGRFHWADYVVFGVTLLMSTGVGIYFACTGQRQKTTEEFLMAGRNMQVVPVAVSLFVTWLSAVACLGDPVEVYTYGAQYWLIGIGYCLAIPPIVHYFVPKYHSLNITSVNEFLEQRFGQSIRLLACFLGLATWVLYMGIVLYGPSLALNQVSGLPVWISIVVVGTVCAFYTSVGGMRAVLWADTLQMLVMVAGLLAVLIQGIIRVGGIHRVWQIADRGGRLNFWNFDPNPLVRNTFWTYVIGGFFRVLAPYIHAQPFVQRYCTTKTARQAQLAVYLNMVLHAGCVSLFALIGLVMYAYYHNCDPLTSGQITRLDQMLPLMVLDVLGHLPGIPGLFLACIFSASLSSLSSGLNAVSANVLKDIISPSYMLIHRRSMPDTTATAAAKLISVLFGGAVVGVAFLVLHTRGNVFPVAVKVTGAFGGPITGIFLLGFFCPFVDACSALIACLVSVGVSIWLGVGSLLHTAPSSSLPVSVDGCSASDVSNTTVSPTTVWLHASSLTENSSSYSTQASPEAGFELADLYHLSPLYFAFLGILITLIIGTLLGAVSALCKKCRKKGEDGWKKKETYHVQRRNVADGVEIIPLNIERNTPYRKSNSFSRLPRENSEDDLQPLTTRTPSYKGIYRSRPGLRVSDPSLSYQDPVGYRVSERSIYRDDEPILQKYLALPADDRGPHRSSNSLKDAVLTDNVPKHAV